MVIEEVRTTWAASKMYVFGSSVYRNNDFSNLVVFIRRYSRSGPFINA